MPSTGESNGDAGLEVTIESAPPAETPPAPKSPFLTSLRATASRVAEACRPGANLATQTEFLLAFALAVIAGVAFYYTISANQKPFDYTPRIAGALLKGRLGIDDVRNLSWLNELVPWNKTHYSVFPLGAVLCMMPVALLEAKGLVQAFPAQMVASILAAAAVFYFFLLSRIQGSSLLRRAVLALFPVFATWTWCNVGFAGAWQLALGFALVGGAGALYYALVAKRYFVAGIFFAIAWGNRTEIILTTPIFLYFCWLSNPGDPAKPELNRQRWWQTARCAIAFVIVPTLLGIATMAYNYARFGSIFDFGYSHIPGVLKEPWYRHGLFSLHAIPWNIYKMLFEGMDDVPKFPYLRPHPFGCSIFVASPILFLLFREGGKHRALYWIAIAVLTFALWCHGNPGGWQFSYRYGMILLPWMFLIILANGPAKLSVIEAVLFVSSVAINAIATYQLK